MSRPNVLLIMSDEHDAAVTGCYGNDVIHTPNLDELARGGVTFDACYCNSPLCAPSRSSFTAGKYVSRVGAWSNECELPSADYPSLPRVLAEGGYLPLLCGKQHYDRSRRYGFVEIGAAGGNQAVKNGRGVRRAADDLAPPTEVSQRFERFHAGDDSPVLRHDRLVTEGALQFLSTRTRSDSPFFLFLGYIAPHFPLVAPQALWERYRGRVPAPVIPDGHLDSLPLNYKHLRTGFQVTDVPEDVVRRSRELYYALTDWLDGEIGRVLTALRQSPIAEDTVVIYTSDHGENLGEHGLWWKNSMFEHSARVPLIVSWPKRWDGEQRRSAACSLVDLVQTVTDVAGTRPPSDWDGDSLLPWLDDTAYRWKDLAVSEYYGHNVASGYVMVRQGRYKYVYHTPPDEMHPPERELYDLVQDPGEFTNLAGSEAHGEVVRRLHDALLAELGEQPDLAEQRSRRDLHGGRQGGDHWELPPATPA